jgi:hypothetical protein
MTEDFNRKNILPEPGENESTRSFSVPSILEDLNKFGKGGVVDALSIQSILRGTIDDLQNRLTDTQNSGASILIQSVSEVSRLLKEDKLPKKAEWYSELQKRMSALDILMIGANFDPKFQDKAEKGFDGELEEMDRFFKWLEKKGISMSQYGEMSDEEIDRCHHEFDTEVSKGLN